MLGGLAWDPQIRGFLIFVAAFVMLPGTIYMLLATNVGARMGLMLAVAGISGWMFILGVTWAFYGQGIKGREPSWKVQEVVESTPAAATNLEEGTLKTLDDFPAKWETLVQGDKILGDAQAAADNFITKSGRKPKMGHEGPIIKEPTPAQLALPCPFLRKRRLQGPRRISGRVATTSCSPSTSTSSSSGIHRTTSWCSCKAYLSSKSSTVNRRPRPWSTPQAEVVNVILLRDLGSVRFPQVMMSIGSLIIFLVTCLQLASPRPPDHGRPRQRQRRSGYRVRTKGQGQTHG